MCAIALPSIKPASEARLTLHQQIKTRKCRNWPQEERLQTVSVIVAKRARNFQTQSAPFPHY
jgi:hypothetical protein